jgi:hypothetical protein
LSGISAAAAGLYWGFSRHNSTLAAGAITTHLASAGTGLVEGDVDTADEVTQATADAVDALAATLLQHTTSLAAIKTRAELALPAAAPGGSGGVAIVGSEMTMAPRYWCPVDHDRDQGNVLDRWSAPWLKDFDAAPGPITGATIQVVKCSDGSVVIPETAMVQVGSTSVFRYVATDPNERMTKGQSYQVTCKATIDGSLRTWGPVVRSLGNP